MEYFKNSFLFDFETLLYAGLSQGLINFAIFTVVSVTALELSRRIPVLGTPLAIILIAGSAFYLTGALDMIM